jgi:hypothetical protein
MALPNCTCMFVDIGKPMDNTDCLLHRKSHYVCEGDLPGDTCGCQDYRPRAMVVRKTNGDIVWSRCVCGHIAQAHN